MLRVSVRTIHRFCAQGLLEPVYIPSEERKHFRVGEVAALSEVRIGKLNFTEVTILATRALVTARANERRLDELLRLLGLKRKVLSTLTEDVASLYEQASHRVALEWQPSSEELEEWAGTFYAVDETFLGLVERLLGTGEPWKALLDLANKLAATHGTSFVDKTSELRTAYDYLEAARRNLRTVSYMYCRQRKGAALATDLFGGEKVSDKVLNLMFAD